MNDFVRKSDVLDLLYGIFDKYKMSTDKNTSIGKSFGTGVFEEIRNMPAAYDVDKVVKELEENASRYTKKYLTPYGNNGYRDTKAISIHKAIEIVKHGGVSDDVCEWKQTSSAKYKTSCDYKLEEYFDTNACYCKQCGKKIKIVGD